MLSKWLHSKIDENNIQKIKFRKNDDVMAALDPSIYGAAVLSFFIPVTLYIFYCQISKNRLFFFNFFTRN